MSSSCPHGWRISRIACLFPSALYAFGCSSSTTTAETLGRSDAGPLVDGGPSQPSPGARDSGAATDASPAIDAAAGDSAASRDGGGNIDAGDAAAVGASCTVVETWGAAIMSGDAGSSAVAPKNSGFHDQTVRQVVHVTASGEAARVRLSNAFGTTPLTIGAARIAPLKSGSTIDPAGDTPLTFGGATSVQIAPGGEVTSDPSTLPLVRHEDVAISLYLSGTTGPATFHATALSTTFINTKGDETSAGSLSGGSTQSSWFFATGVDVCASPQTKVVVAFGDSITDGYNSDPNTNSRWPDVLARRLEAANIGPWSVVNSGISGNALLSETTGPSGASRLSRDIFSRAGVTHVILLEGINDIGFAFGFKQGSLTTDQLTGEYKAIIAAAHSHGVRVIGATLLPYKGAIYYADAGESVRQAVNAWIRTSGAFDGVIDFEAVVRDPSAPTAYLKAYDSGDHLHPNSAGYAAMANAIDLSLF